jgi:hypothetical protein
MKGGLVDVHPWALRGGPAAEPALQDALSSKHTYSVKLRRSVRLHGASVARGRSPCSYVSAMRVLLNMCTYEDCDGVIPWSRVARHRRPRHRAAS